MVPYENIQSFFLVSLGAVIGANIRFVIYEKLGKTFFVRKDLRILFINSLSSFLLGLFSTILTNPIFVHYTYKLSLIFAIGFFGSLSTFSTFIYDFFKLISILKFGKSITILISSIFFGMFFLWLGVLLGYELS